MSEFLKKFEKRHKGYFSRGEDLIKSGKWHLKSNTVFKNKLASFYSENSAVNQMVSRLSVFIKGVEGERHLKYIQKYIDDIVIIINVHLERIERYYLNNEPDIKWEQTSKILQENDFQQELFKGETKIRESLDKLNILDSSDNINIQFHASTEFATIPFVEILKTRSVDLERKIDSLKIDWDLIQSNEFLIHRKKAEIPYYNPKKHFFDQDTKVLQFYVSEWNKIKYGFKEGGYFVHPWLYWHLNYFKTAIPIEDGTQPIINPPLRRNEWYFAEILKKAEENKKGAIFIFGTRRFAKSVMEASYLFWKSLITPNSETSVTISNTKDRISITDKISVAINNIHPAFRPTINKEDWEKKVEFGLKEPNGTKLKHCDIEITNLESGSKKASQKVAGGAPVAFIYDESGKSDFLAAYNAAKYSFKTPFGWKTIPIFTGTGSNVDITKDAEKVLDNPELYDFLPMDWELLEYKIPKEGITWKRRKFAFFVPGQMGYEDYFAPPIEYKFSDFLDVKSSILNKVIFREPDWVYNSKVILEKREEYRRVDKSEYQAYCVFVPIDPEDCLMSAATNPFPVTEAKKTKARLIAEGNTSAGLGKAVTLFRDKDNPEKIGYDLSDKEVAIYPFTGGFIDSPVILYEEIPEEKPPMYMYVAGLDDYRQDEADGDSLGSFTIYNRITRKIAATLTTRPDPHGDFHKQIHLLLDAFNAICLPENEDMDIKKYFDRFHLSYKYLGSSFDVSAAAKFTDTGRRRFGWQPGKFTTPFVLGLVLDHCKENIEVKNEDGEVIDIIKGVETINDIFLLEEIIKYRKDGNFDRIISFGSSLLYDFYCTLVYKNPKIKREADNEQENSERKRPAKREVFPVKRRSLF